jgi:serine/threonine protein kinase
MTFEMGGYRAVEMIGAGASAQVWSGVRVSDDAAVAIKVFAPDQLAAAQREAALAAAVNHPHLVAVLDVVGDAERAALVTELAVGGDLAALLVRRGRLTAGETLTVLLPMAAALATAHERQIVHGDLSMRPPS